MENILNEIMELKNYLSITDIKQFEYLDGYITASDYEAIKIKRNNARNRINQLENALAVLGYKGDEDNGIN